MIVMMKGRKEKVIDHRGYFKGGLFTAELIIYLQLLEFCSI